MDISATRACGDLFIFKGLSWGAPAFVYFSMIFITVVVGFLIKPYLVFGHQADEAIALSAGNQAAFQFQQAVPSRYLLFEINPGEGFNLRRDVYIRIANLVRALNSDGSDWWTLVLPPYNRLYHWQSTVLQSQISWSTFFDLDSFSLHVPVMEFVDFLNVSQRQIDEIYYLQNYKEGWKNGKWEEKMDDRDCIERNSFVEDIDGSWRWAFWDYPNVTGKSFRCISIQAQATFLKSFLQHKTRAKSVFLVRAEQLIHGTYSEWSVEYWTARRSMRFAKHLRKIGDEFRSVYFNSTDASDQTVMADDWRKMQKQHGDAVGGPYIAVHLRRRDFLYSHPDKVPSIEGAAKRIESALQQFGLRLVFVSSDCSASEFEKLRELLKKYEVHRYEPEFAVLERYKDGGIAIIDQWICAHARYFIGTAVSTFSFRIHEEREILGFKPETTFNCFCADAKPDCEQPTKWTVVYS